MNKTAISIDRKARKEVCEILNLRLAELTDLYSLAKYSHWNVRGQNFYTYHELFERVAKSANEHIDELAERVTTLGGVAEGTIRMASAASKLSEIKGPFKNGGEYVKHLVKCFGHCSNALRESIDAVAALEDPISADLLTAIGGKIDTSLWLLEASN